MHENWRDRNSDCSGTRGFAVQPVRDPSAEVRPVIRRLPAAGVPTSARGPAATCVAPPGRFLHHPRGHAGLAMVQLMRAAVHHSVIPARQRPSPCWRSVALSTRPIPTDWTTMPCCLCICTVGAGPLTALSLRHSLEVSKEGRPHSIGGWSPYPFLTVPAPIVTGTPGKVRRERGNGRRKAVQAGCYYDINRKEVAAIVTSASDPLRNTCHQETAPSDE